MSKAPKLRFKEFSGDWETKKFKDIVKINQGLQIAISDRYTEDGENRLFYITNEFLKKESGKKYYIENPPSSVICKESDILMTRTGNTGQVVTGVSGAFHNNFFKINYDSNSHNKMFLYYILTSFKLQKSIIRLAGTSTIPDLNHGDFYNIRISYPSIEEQEKIASFFSLIDDKISLQGEKVEALKDYKRGMMQKIFSRELRFKDDEGRDYPEWEERKIKDIFIVTRGVVIAKTEISESKDDKNKYPVYSSQTTNNGILGYDSSYDFEGDYLTWTTDGANAGKVFRRNGKFRCTNVCGVLVEKQETLGFANKMISEILNKETPKHVSYVGNPKLMNGVMGDIKIKVPILDEQIKISKVLDNIDLKIEKEQEKLDCLNEYKKGLLQQMFV